MINKENQLEGKADTLSMALWRNKLKATELTSVKNEQPLNFLLIV